MSCLTLITERVEFTHTLQRSANQVFIRKSRLCLYLQAGTNGILEGINSKVQQQKNDKQKAIVLLIILSRHKKAPLAYTSEALY